MGINKKVVIYKVMRLTEAYKLAVVLFFIILFIIPNFITRLISVLGAIIYIINKNKRLDKKIIFTILLVLFVFAFIFSPYWNIFKAIPLKIISLIAILFIGILWAKFSSAELILNFKFKDKIYLIVLTILLFITNYKNLISDIAWRGDEDYHIRGVLDVLVKPGISAMQDMGTIFLLSIMIATIGLLVYYKYYKKLELNKLRNLIATVYISIIFLVVYVVSVIFTSALDKNMRIVTRFPFLMKWIMSFFVFPAEYDVLLYRFVPFLSIILISWFLYYKINKHIQKKIISMLLSFVFTTTPVLFFFSSLVYLEMPIVLLMTIVIFNIGALVKSRVNELFRKPEWYCLLLVTFIKETAIIIVILFIIIRLLYWLFNKKLIQKTIRINLCLLKNKNILQEIKIYLILLTPVIIYLVFRILAHDSRPHGMQILNLIQSFSYLIFVKALFNQLGLVLIVAVAGLILGLLTKDRINYILSLIFFVGISLFFIGDKFIYIGYARWNLFLIPMILFFSMGLIKNLKNRYFKFIIPLLLILSIGISNFILLPTNFDGVRKSNWGSPLSNTAEYTYPYKETFEWLKKNEGEINHILITGYNYPGYHQFYLEKYDFNLSKVKADEFIPQKIKYKFFNETIEKCLLYNILKDLNNIRNNNKSKFLLFDQAQIQNFTTVDTIVYFSLNNIELIESTLLIDKFKVEKKITNGKNSIYIIKPA